MMYFDDDGRAFSVAWPDGVALMEPGQPLATYEQHLRDVAALAALPAVIDVCRADTRHVGETSAQMFARKALEVADAFLAARNKEDDR